MVTLVSLFSLVTPVNLVIPIRLVTLVTLCKICTLHNFQFYLAHLWTDFQSCCSKWNESVTNWRRVPKNILILSYPPNTRKTWIFEEKNLTDSAEFVLLPQIWSTSGWSVTTFSWPPPVLFNFSQLPLSCLIFHEFDAIFYLVVIVTWSCVHNPLFSSKMRRCIWISPMIELLCSFNHII